MGLAHLDQVVTGVDRDPARVAALAAGELAEAEPGLRAALRSALRHRKLEFTCESHASAYDAVFLCVDTPPLNYYELDLSQVLGACHTAAALLQPHGLLITRSTIPPGTGDRLEAVLRSIGRSDIAVVHVPEFLREGHAWEDFREPDRIVIGASDDDASREVAAIFAPLGAPVFHVDRRTAELAKYAANAFLATSISFANELAELGSAVQADTRAVFEVLRADRRIGQYAYLAPGLGFGGHCLPKDIAALERIAAVHGCSAPVLRAAREVNRTRIDRTVSWLRGALGGLHDRRVCLLGLAFKPGTDDTRESPALQLGRALAIEGAEVSGWDEWVRSPLEWVAIAPSAIEAARGADALVLAHPSACWGELDPAAFAAAMRQHWLFDPASAIDPGPWQDAGFSIGGRSLPGPATVLADRVES